MKRAFFRLRFCYENEILLCLHILRICLFCIGWQVVEFNDELEGPVAEGEDEEGL